MLWNLLLDSFRQNHIWNNHVKVFLGKKYKEERILHTPSMTVPILLNCTVQSRVILFQSSSFYCKLRQVSAFSFILIFGSLVHHRCVLDGSLTKMAGSSLFCSSRQRTVTAWACCHNSFLSDLSYPWRFPSVLFRSPQHHSETRVTYRWYNWLPLFPS